eukprot:GHRR01002801.1.p1 GENE.GHRR01002801.1~~GHRR01002801.1.p1  ORF type:complete len:274 (+),score=76.10 GHRR01002801.1:147-968(+)
MAALFCSQTQQQRLVQCAVRQQTSWAARRVQLPPSSRLRVVSVQATVAKAPVQPVKINIQGRRLQVTDAIKSYVEEKITKAVHNYAHSIKKIDVTLSARGGDTGTRGDRQQKVDVTIATLKSGLVRVEDSEGTLYASIDVVCDKVSRKLRKVKEKLISQGNWPGRGGPRVNTEEQDFKEYMDNVMLEVMTATLDEEEARAAELQGIQAGASAAMPAAVMRSKVLRLDPMSTEEAIDALEAVGHDFYVFKDSKANNIQVVYKRESGGYGILIPQ